MNFIFIILIIGAVFVLLSTTLTVAACMLSSRISQKEEFVETLVHAVNQQMAAVPPTEDQVE
ncbi:MAG: hypothetical protein P8183_16725 [Anaerolineae bacterium]